MSDLCLYSCLMTVTACVYRRPRAQVVGEAGGAGLQFAARQGGDRRPREGRPPGAPQLPLRPQRPGELHSAPHPNSLHSNSSNLSRSRRLRLGSGRPTGAQALECSQLTNGPGDAPARLRRRVIYRFHSHDPPPGPPPVPRSVAAPGHDV